jgi:hypothetical protein
MVMAAMMTGMVVAMTATIMIRTSMDSSVMRCYWKSAAV